MVVNPERFAQRVAANKGFPDKVAAYPDGRGGLRMWCARAAAALYVALADTRSPDAARRALAFADPTTRAGALALLRELEQEASEAA